MRKPLLFTLVCVLLVSGFDSAWAQTARKVDSARSRSSATSPAAQVRHIVVDARQGELFGSFNGKTWLDALKTMPLVKKGDTFRLYSLTGPVGTGVISEIVPPEYPCEDNVGVNISPLPEGEGDIIGVNGTWNAQPRLPKIQSTDQQEYRVFVSNYLKGVGVSNPKVAIFQLLRVDLDGDGTEEVLIAANSSENPLSSHFLSKGDYSVVLLRRVAQGKAQTIPIVSEVELKNHKDPMQTGQWHHKETVAAILDLDGDGRMEIITTFRSIFDGGKNVYDPRGRKPRQVLGWYCSGGH
jgi:hypothetical protein